MSSDNLATCVELVTQALVTLTNAGVAEIPTTFVRGFFVASDRTAVQYKVRRDVAGGDFILVMTEIRGSTASDTECVVKLMTPESIDMEISSLLHSKAH